MGYGAIAEQEVAADRAADIEGSMFALQAIAVPGGGDGRYVALIDGLGELPIRFNPDEESTSMLRLRIVRKTGSELLCNNSHSPTQGPCRLLDPR